MAISDRALSQEWYANRSLSLGPDAEDDGVLLDGGNIAVPHSVK